MTKQTTSKKQLPLGIQTFANLRNGNYYYVDKTPWLIELSQYKAVFLSRPRRFGKSLTLSTLAEMFQGNKSLFTGLYAEDNWDWSQSHPVIRISFGSSDNATPESVEATIKDNLTSLEKEFGVTLQSDTVPRRFTDIIQHCYNTTGKLVVILIDEYDKPMVDNLHAKHQIIPIRNQLRSLYGVIKDNEAYVRFAMLTGVSKFSKVNVFSGLNSLTDISLSPKYSAICGYTQSELEAVFAPELEGVDLALMRQWYNGYNWGGESVYNPYDVLLFLQEYLYKAYWMKTGTSAWLIDNITTHKVDMLEIEQKTYNEMQLDGFDIDNENPIAILFQTGYLTIAETKATTRGVRYRLKSPNIEVLQGLNQMLMERYLGQAFDVVTEQDIFYDNLIAKDFDKIQLQLTSMFAGIPHQWYTNNPIARYEGYWAGLMYSFLTGMAVRINTETSTAHGRIDMWFEMEGVVYIFEFKVVRDTNTRSQHRHNVQIEKEELKATDEAYQTAIDKAINEATDKAMNQIDDKHYADKFQFQQSQRALPIVKVGIVFGARERNLVAMKG